MTVKNLPTQIACHVEMRGITKSYGATAALTNVDLSLRVGEIHAVLGENGAGKSTLMHILSGQTQPTSGEILFSGSRVLISSPKDARRLGIAMVHQHFTLAPALSVTENLALDAISPTATALERFISGIRFSANDLAAPALAQANRLGWSLSPDAPVSSLSVGQQQRTEIVKALATNADVLIFDEPTAVLNADEIDELFAVLRLLRSENKAIVLIAHKLSEILAISDRVTVLRKGALVATSLKEGVDAPRLAAWMIGASLASTTLAAPGVGADERGQVMGHASRATVCRAVNISVNGSHGETLISGLNLEVFAGEIYGIGGVDGNGQAELAEVLAGLRPADAGELTIVANSAGYIPQDRQRSGLAVTMSVCDNLLFEAAQDPEFRTGPFLRVKALRTMGWQLVSDYDIRTPGVDVPVSTLSGGNQQKIVVARALRPNPQWIVAMNPTRGLDIGATRFVHDQLRKARDHGAAVVVISTDLDELAAIADRTAILSGGSLQPYNAGSTDAADIGLLLGGVSRAVVSGDPSANSV